MPAPFAHQTRWVMICLLAAGLILGGCRGSTEHRYMLYNDTSGQRQVSLCTDDHCSDASSVGWVDPGAYAEVTLPGDRVVLKVTSVASGYVCAEGDDDLAGVLVALSKVAATAPEAATRCVS